MQWHAIGKNIDNIESHSDFALYISFSTNPKFGWSCPIRVDKDLVRRSIVIQSPNSSVSCLIHFQKWTR